MSLEILMAFCKDGFKHLTQPPAMLPLETKEAIQDLYGFITIRCHLVLFTISLSGFESNEYDSFDLERAR